MSDKEEFCCSVVECDENENDMRMTDVENKCLANVCFKYILIVSVQ